MGSSYTVPGSIKLPKVLNQQFREDSDLSRRVVPRWSDDEDPNFGERIVIHQRYQSAGRELFLGQKIRQRGDAEPGDGCRRKSHPVVGFESTVRVHGNRLISFNEVPGLCALRETFMRQQLVRRFGSPMLPDIFGAGDELAVDRRDPPCDQVRVAEVSDANCAVKTFADDVDETVTVARMNVKARMSPRELRKHRCQMRGTEGWRGRDPQSAAQIARWQDRLSREIDFGARPRGVVAECHARFGERGPTGCPRQKLDTKLRFKPD